VLPSGQYLVHGQSLFTIDMNTVILGFTMWFHSVGDSSLMALGFEGKFPGIDL